MTEVTAKRNKIHFFEEKKWIMVYWFKTRGKTQFTEKYLLEQWRKLLGNDFKGISDERLHDTLVWLKETFCAMTKKEIKQKRHDIADDRPMPQCIKKLAAKKGFYVKKCSTRNHPLKVSGYAVFKKQKDKKPVYGKRFDLTVKQVEAYLNKREDK